MSGECIFRARDLALGYGDREVLRGVSLEVRDGESWFWIGPNGSGKTTLLRAMLGLLPAREGLLERGPSLAPAFTGYVPQRSEFHPSLPVSVREFVSLGFVGSRVPRRARRRVLAEGLARAGLAGLERAPFASLSGGQRQRALVARALVRQPKVLVLDEPTEGLDVTTQDALLATLVELRDERALTLVVVTHRLDIAERFASHMAIFRDGRVEAGPRDLVRERGGLERAFARVELAVR